MMSTVLNDNDSNLTFASAKDPGSESKVYGDNDIAYALCKSTGILGEAAIILGCSRRVISDALKCSPKLRDIKRECEETWLDMAYATICRHVEAGDLTAAIFLVRMLWPAHHGRRA